MTTITILAQSYSDRSDTFYTTNAFDPALSAGFTIMIISLFFFLWIGLYAVVAVSLMRIFKKAGVKPWIAWVPFYNQWKLLEIGGQQGFWAVLTILPVVSIVSNVFTYIAMYHIGKKLGKDDWFVLLAIFIPLVWFIWLAVDSSDWNDKASSAPSLNHA